MTSIVKSIINKLSFKETPVLLGRWKIDYCTIAINRKVMMTNEDHCGICDSTIIFDKIQKDKNEDETEWLKYMI